MWRATSPDGARVLVKHGNGAVEGHLAIEAAMLKALAATETIPVPRVLFSEPDLLIMDWVDSVGGMTKAHQFHAGELLARLHTLPQSGFGYEIDTTIGGLSQPNPACENWLTFFRDHRLLYMASAAHAEGRLSRQLLGRLENLAARLEEWIDEPPHPALLHGDVWGGNVLCGAHGKIAAFIDPAIYHGHPEIELAFTQMFATFGAPFFESYAANAPFDKKAFAERQHLYNLYPTLVHVRLFGSSYIPPVERTLQRFGF